MIYALKDYIKTKKCACKGLFLFTLIFICYNQTMTVDENSKKEDEQNHHSLGIGPERIKKLEKEKQVELLLRLAQKRGVEHAVEVAKGLDDPYVLDRFHDEVTKSDSK